VILRKPAVETAAATNGSRELMPLSFAAIGETVTLAEIRAGERLRRRLGDLGLNIGMSARVVQNDTCGQMILAVTNDARLAIGRGMAHKIIVWRNL
jgi:Fe2+ transport system protein FeoA